MLFYLFDKTPYTPISYNIGTNHLINFDLAMLLVFWKLYLFPD